jgi:hypothetical protein
VLVGPVGLEPTTYGLKVRSSAIELEARRGAGTRPHEAGASRAGCELTGCAAGFAALPAPLADLAASVRYVQLDQVWAS